jgi:SSS family solute:Na+ symporter
MPRAGSVSWWTLVSTVVLGVGIGVLAQPQLSIRFMTVKSSKDLNRAVVIGGIFIFLMTFVPYVTGSLSNVYFYNTTGKLSLEAAGANIDKIIPTFINSIMPPWFVYIFMLTLLAAAMSTISAQFHVIGTSFARDVFRRYDYKTPEKDAVSTGAVNRRGLYYPKIGIVIGIIISVALGYFLPTSIIAKGTSLFFGVCAATFLPVYIFALFWKGATRPGAISSMFTGLFSSLAWMLFINAGVASKVGLCKLIFGRDTLAGFPWNSVDAIMIAFPLSFLVAFIVSLATKKTVWSNELVLPGKTYEK